MVNVSNLNQICMEREQNKRDCLEWNDLINAEADLIEAEAEKRKAINEKLRAEINSAYSGEEWRAIHALNCETYLATGVEIVRALFQEHNGWTVDELHERMPRYEKSSIPTFCNNIGAYSERTGRYWQ